MNVAVLTADFTPSNEQFSPIARTGQELPLPSSLTSPQKSTFILLPLTF